MAHNKHIGVSSHAMNAAAPEHYGFDIGTFDPINVRGELTPKAKETMRLQAIRQAMKVPLYQVFVTDEKNETIPVGPKRVRGLTLRLMETIEVAIKTGTLTGWQRPRIEMVVQPNTGLGICRDTDALIQGA